MTFQFKQPEKSPGLLLWQITNHWQRLQRDALSTLGITHAQFVILATLLWLSDQKEDVTQQVISEFSGIDKMTTSDLISILTQKKMIKKSKSKKDGRAFVLSLTAKGKKLTLKAVPIVEKIDQNFFEHKTEQFVQFIQLIA